MKVFHFNFDICFPSCLNYRQLSKLHKSFFGRNVKCILVNNFLWRRNEQREIVHHFCVDVAKRQWKMLVRDNYQLKIIHLWLSFINYYAFWSDVLSKDFPVKVFYSLIWLNFVVINHFFVIKNTLNSKKMQ